MPTPRPIVLLMTATVDPKGCPDARFAVSERQRQYLSAFAFYLRKLARGGGYDAILFCENSGADLSAFRALVPPALRDRVAFLSAPPERFTPEKGKSYNEALLMDLALEACPARWAPALFFKVTGRYAILNIGTFLRECRKAGPSLQLFCDQKDHRLFSRLGLSWCEQWGETRYFAFTQAFWDTWFRAKAGRDGRDFEAFIFDVARANYGRKDCRFRFRQEAFIHGVGGGNHVHFANLPLPFWAERPWFFLRAMVDTLLRRLFPKWWF